MTGKIKKIISIENGNNYVADIEDIENRITQNSSNLETAKQELSNKCNEALNEAKAYTDNNNFFKSDGSSPLTPTPGLGNASVICLNRDDSCIRIFGGTPNGGTQYEVGGQLVLNGKDRSEQITGGQLVALRANGIKDGTRTTYDLNINKDGRLIFDGRDIVRSVNGVNADANGNVIISDIYENGNGYIRFTNGLQICFSGANTSNPNVSFSKPFFNTPLIFCSGVGNAHGWGSSNVGSTGFTVLCSDGSLGQYCYFFAIGFWK